MTDAVVTSFQALLDVVGGGSYAIEQATMTFSGSGMNTLSATLNLGISPTGAAVTISLKRGQSCTLQIINGAITTSASSPNEYGGLFPQNLNLFRGVIEDFGPVQLSPGVFALQVLARGRLMWLASETLNATGIKANQYTDASIVYSDRFGSILPPFQLDPTLSRSDLAAALKATFFASASAFDNPTDFAQYAPAGSIARQLLDIFGGNANSLVRSTIAGMSGELIWRDITTRDTERIPLTDRIVEAITDRLNEALTYDWYGESYLTRYQNIGSNLFFRVIEVCNDIRVVPYVPFFRSIDAYPLLPSTVSSIQWVINEQRACRGTALLSGPGTDTEQEQMIIGWYNSPGNPTGAVYIMEAPSILMRNTGDNRFESETGSQARSVIGDIGNLGDRYAKFYTWDANYGSRQLRVTSPTLRTDIGPLEAVRVDFPAVPDVQAAVNTIAMYGSVVNVTITLDATRGQALTTYDISHVRSYQQQQDEIDAHIVAREHPFFTDNYFGGRLDSDRPRSISGGVSIGGTFGDFVG